MPNIEFASSLGQGLWQFVSYMGLAIFAENVILARAMGVTRLMKLVPDHKAQVWDFCLPLIFVMTLSAPLGWAAHNLFFPWLRPNLPVMQHRHAGHTAHQLQPELYAGAVHRVRPGQRPGVHVYRVHCAGGPPPSAQQGRARDLPGPAQFHDLHWRSLTGHLCAGGAFCGFVNK